MTHYDKKYFDWQQNVGIVGGVLNKFKFENYINDTDILMDFGCGGGYLLNNFNNKIKFGYEINQHARDECRKKNIDVYDNFDNIQNNSIDTIISNHAMEHVPLPLETLKQLYLKLKSGGKIIIVIPCEQPTENGFYYKPNDVNQHLHTWCPMTFGNLVTLSGFNVTECIAFQHQWPPNFQMIYKDDNIHEQCIKHAKKNNNFQIKLVATK